MATCMPIVDHMESPRMANHNYDRPRGLSMNNALLDRRPDRQQSRSPRPRTFHELSRPLARAASAAGFDISAPLNIMPVPIQLATSPQGVQMRRESFADKVKIEEALSRSPSRERIHWKQIASPRNMSISHWSPDNSDTEEEIQVTTARRVSRADAVSLKVFSKAAKIGPTPHRMSLISQARRESAESAIDSSASSTTSLEGIKEQPDSPTSNTSDQDIVKIITAMQAAHLQETRRLNEVITSLTQRLAGVENELAHTRDAKVQDDLSTWQSNYTTEKSPRSSTTCT